jgi:hypothetical protein
MDAFTEDQSPQIRQTTIRWDDAISRTRMLPDFSRFLLPPLFSDLQQEAEDGHLSNLSMQASTAVTP